MIFIFYLIFRTKILEQDESKDRERLVMKFIKIMKWLRKQNNFNSYLALLSALDSAPIRRLEWQRSITEGLKEYCALIDSSSSFRAYRQALSESRLDFIEKTISIKIHTFIVPSIHCFLFFTLGHHVYHMLDLYFKI